MAEKKNVLRGRIIEKYGSVKAFADAAGLNYQNIINKLNGRTFINPEETKKWAQALDISIEEIGHYFYA